MTGEDTPYSPAAGRGLHRRLGVRGGGKFRCEDRFGLRRCQAVRGLECARGSPFDQEGDEVSDAASVEPEKTGLDQALDHRGVEVGVTLDQSRSDDVDIVFFAVVRDDDCPPGRARQEHVSADDFPLCRRGWDRTEGELVSLPRVLFPLMLMLGGALWVLPSRVGFGGGGEGLRPSARVREVRWSPISVQLVVTISDPVRG